MCEVITHNTPVITDYASLPTGQAGRRDPTRTTSLRNTFSREMTKRFSLLRGIIRRAVVTEDVFGLRNPSATAGITAMRRFQTPGPRRFAFPSSSAKVSAFMAWLQSQVQSGVLEVSDITQVGTGINAAWTNKFISQGYRQGVFRARRQMIQLGANVPTIEQTGGLSVIMGTPVHADRVGLLYTRVFSDLKGITDNMDTQISRVLSEGLSRGINPNDIAKRLNAVISRNGASLEITDTLGRFVTAEQRAKTLARTEIIRAHAEGQLQEFENWRVSGVRGKAEWVTSGKPCPQCEPKEGNVFSIADARGLIPYHPNCYDKETEVYTNEGWKLFKKVNGKERFLSYSIENDRQEFVGAKNLVYYISTKMWQFKDDKVNLWVTGNHNMLCEIGGKIQLIEAYKLDSGKEYSFFVGEAFQKHKFNSEPKIQSYNDYVYCVELERNHTLLVRRNGKIVWSGNCRCSWIPVID